jgi:hypothetical protein
VKRRGLLLLPLLGGLSAFFVLGARAPRDQTVEIVLGASAPLVEDVEVRYAEPASPDATRDRIASFHFARGAAPRVVHHEPHVPDGTYRLTLELSSGGQRASVDRTITLRGGGSTSVDVSEAAATLAPSALSAKDGAPR